MENQTQKKPRVLCLHGFRASGEIFKSMLQTRWPETVLEKLDMVYLDGPFPAQGKSSIEDVYDPPYYEWFQCNEDFTEFINFKDCVKYLEDYMVKYGPFDGILGDSQGGNLAASLPGMQNEGVALTRVPEIKFLIFISAGKFGGATMGTPELAANAFSSPIERPSLHFIGDKDALKPGGEDLVKAFVDPVVIRHPEGHTVPTLDKKQAEVVLGFIEKIQNLAKFVLASL